MEETEEVINGVRITPKNEIPIELSAAVCLGCMLGIGISYLIIQIISLV
tara:strand:+ start:209 stop:355 length:147 start_codon:yes stop_codon:yes gene_type:complete